jgi:excisionase family DNA binding protein
MKSIYIEEVCLILNVERTRALELVQSGELPAAKIGRSWVFIEELVYNYLHQLILNQTELRKARKAAGEEIRSAVKAGVELPHPDLINIQPNEPVKRSVGRKRNPIPPLPQAFSQIAAT